MRTIRPIIVLAFVGAAPLAAADFPLDPRATYLRLNDDPALAATPFDLATLGIAPGDYVRMESVGDYDNGPGSDTFTSLLGIFSATSTLLPSNNLHRVPDAINAGFDFASSNTFRGNLPTDIPEDFAITHPNVAPSVMIRVPAGAAFLFVGPHDSLYFDNTDPDGDYAFRIAIVECPADVNGDGAVNTIDFIGFLNLWSAQDRQADFDSNGVINTQDVITFLNLWVAGC